LYIPVLKKNGSCLDCASAPTPCGEPPREIMSDSDTDGHETDATAHETDGHETDAQSEIHDVSPLELAGNTTDRSDVTVESSLASPRSLRPIPRAVRKKSEASLPEVDFCRMSLDKRRMLGKFGRRGQLTIIKDNPWRCMGPTGDMPALASKNMSYPPPPVERPMVLSGGKSFGAFADFQRRKISIDYEKNHRGMAIAGVLPDPLEGKEVGEEGAKKAKKGGKKKGGAKKGGKKKGKKKK
jgi:hypothetical protein